MNLKIGQQFEVVEVLTDGGYQDGIFKVGGHTLGLPVDGLESFYILINGVDTEFLEPDPTYGGKTGYMYGNEVKPVGRLTVTKLK